MIAQCHFVLYFWSRYQNACNHPRWRFMAAEFGILASAMSSLLMLPGQIHSCLLCKRFDLCTAALLVFCQLWLLTCATHTTVDIFYSRDVQEGSIAAAHIVQPKVRVWAQIVWRGPLSCIGFIHCKPAQKTSRFERASPNVLCLLQRSRSTRHGVREGRQLFSILEQARTSRSYQPGDCLITMVCGSLAQSCCTDLTSSDLWQILLSICSCKVSGLTGKSFCRVLRRSAMDAPPCQTQTCFLTTHPPLLYLMLGSKLN